MRKRTLAQQNAHASSMPDHHQLLRLRRPNSAAKVWLAIPCRVVAARHPEIVDRLITLGIPHPIAWGDNMSVGQLRKSWYMSAFYAPFMPEQLLPATDLKGTHAVL